jgi:lipopolysaccharide assembly protein A
MRFLTTMLWIAILIGLAVFATNNWVPVTLYLWNNQVMDTYLPIPLFIALLAGILPYFIALRATRWSMGRKLASAERSASTASNIVPVQAPPVQAPTQTSPSLTPVTPSVTS